MGKKCSIIGCENKHAARGFCRKHYQTWRNSHSPTNKICSVKECDKPVYAKGLCHNHYELKRRNGYVIYKRDMPKPKCFVRGCQELARGPKGLCKFHTQRAYLGIDLDRPKGNKGELNIHWKGGIAQYPNHSEMKRVRKVVLEEANYLCFYCGKEANQIHHKDLTKHNHSKENLVACCNRCNHKRSKKYTSKFRRLYGKTLPELSKCINVSSHTIHKHHNLYGNLARLGFFYIGKPSGALLEEENQAQEA